MGYCNECILKHFLTLDKEMKQEKLNKKKENVKYAFKKD